MSKKKVLTLCLIFISIVLFSCKSKELATNKKDFELIFQTNIIETEAYNQDKSMILVVRYKEDKNPRKTINYKVVETKSKKVLREGVFSGTKLEWFTKNQLRGHFYVGMVEKESDEVLVENDKKENKNILIIEIK